MCTILRVLRTAVQYCSTQFTTNCVQYFVENRKITLPVFQKYHKYSQYFCIDFKVIAVGIMISLFIFIFFKFTFLFALTIHNTVCQGVKCKVL